MHAIGMVDPVVMATVSRTVRLFLDA